MATLHNRLTQQWKHASVDRMIARWPKEVPKGFAFYKNFNTIPFGTPILSVSIILIVTIDQASVAHALTCVGPNLTQYSGIPPHGRTLNKVSQTLGHKV